MEDERKRAMNSLRAIREGLENNMCDIESPLVTEYHSALDKLKKQALMCRISAYLTPGFRDLIFRQFTLGYLAVQESRENCS